MPFLTCPPAMPLVLQEAKRQLEEVRAALASERSAHDATKQALKRESEQREAALAAAVALPTAAAAAVPAAVASHPISSPGDKLHDALSPREAAEVRQQVLDLEVSMLLCFTGACLVWHLWLNSQQTCASASAALCIALRTQECCAS